jgi:AAA domain
MDIPDSFGPLPFPLPPFPPPPQATKKPPVCKVIEQSKIRKLQWLWPNWLARGHLTILGGEPGIGKSMVVTDLAARMSAGSVWPDGQPMPRRSARKTSCNGRGKMLSIFDALELLRRISVISGVKVLQDAQMAAPFWGRVRSCASTRVEWRRRM